MTLGTRKTVIKQRSLDNGGQIVVSADTVTSEKANDPILELQLSMATSSINHEYARIEYDETTDAERRETLLDYMDQCRAKYTDARTKLTTMSPSIVDQFEAELVQQKKMTLSQYHA